MDKEEIIRRLKKISGHAVHVVGEPPFIMSLDDGIALNEAVRLLKEQDAKEVKESTNMYTGLPITHCPKCGVSIDRYLYGRQHEGQVDYCPFCGQAVKWE